MMMIRYAAVVLTTAALAAACGASEPLENAHPSAQSLAAAVLDAVQRADRSSLTALAVSEREFREHVWPRLPAARPERNLPFSYVWGDLRQKSAGALATILTRHGGRRYELLDTAFEQVTDYGSYRVHRGTTLRVRDAHGAHHVIRLCGSLIEHNGAWKVFSYVID